MEKYLELLSASPLFRGITVQDIPVILKKLHAYTRIYKKDNYIKHAGDPADFIGFVLDGNAQIVQDDYYGNRTIAANLTAGDLFAEAFACAGCRQLPVDVLACSPSTILFIDCDAIFRSCGDRCIFHHTLIENLLHIVAQKNIQLNQKLQYSTRKTTREKLTAYLNEQAKLHNSAEFTIPFNRQALADYLGVDRSAMSTELGKLVKDGVIETNRSHFKLLNT